MSTVVYSLSDYVWSIYIFAQFLLKDCVIVTYEDEHADKQGDQGPRAEGCTHAEGCSIAGLDGSVRVTATYMDGECTSCA